MKKCFIAVLLLGISFTLSAQSPEETAVYVTPVIGEGSGSGDNNFFSGLIIRELKYRNYTIAQSPRSAALTLTAAISPHDIHGDTFTIQMFILHLSLRQNINGEILSYQDLYYTDPDEINKLINPKITALFESFYEKNAENVSQDTGNESEPQENPDMWRSRQWYFSAIAYWTPRVYAAKGTSTHYVNFGFGLYAEYYFIKFTSEKLKFLKYLSLGTGLELAPDWIKISELQDGSYRDLVVELPLLVKFPLKPPGYFLLTPYAGINFNMALYRTTLPPALAWRLGFQYGAKAGPGIVVIDPWFSMDFGKSRLKTIETISYKRYMMHIGLGYKYGLNPKPKQ